MVAVYPHAMMQSKNYIINMLEALKHITGLCGEPHPSLLTLLLGTPFASYVYYKIKNNKK